MYTSSIHKIFVFSLFQFKSYPIKVNIFFINEVNQSELLFVFRWDLNHFPLDVTVAIKEIDLENIMFLEIAFFLFLTKYNLTLSFLRIELHWHLLSRNMSDISLCTPKQIVFKVIGVVRNHPGEDEIIFVCMQIKVYFFMPHVRIFY